MYTTDFSDPDNPLMRVFESVFCSYIEDGSVEVGDKKPEQIINEYKALAKGVATGEVGLLHTLDHRSSLLERAEAEAHNGSFELSVTLYALWIEHTVNGDLIYGLQRKGYSLETIKPLIRELRLNTKVTALWHIAGFEPLAAADILLIDQVSAARNAFGHYKWSGSDEETEAATNERLKNTTERSRELEAVFIARENTLFWNARRGEIISYFWEDVRRHAREFGPFEFGSGST